MCAHLNSPAGLAKTSLPVLMRRVGPMQSTKSLVSCLVESRGQTSILNLSARIYHRNRCFGVSRHVGLLRFLKAVLDSSSLFCPILSRFPFLRLGNETGALEVEDTLIRPLWHFLLFTPTHLLGSNRNMVHN